MKTKSATSPLVSGVFACFILYTAGYAQQPVDRQELFGENEVLTLQLSGNLQALLKDRGDNMQYHPMTLSYSLHDSVFTIPIRARTRGHFRRARVNCNYPPLLLNFSKGKTPASSLFANQNKVKLVTPCQGDKYIVREYLVYQLHNLVTPKSFKARLVKVVYMDSLKDKKSAPLYGMLIEETEHMAKRNNAIEVETKLLKPQQTQTRDFLTMAVFEYLIGNTDWSVQYLQNVKLIAEDSLGIPSTVAYDFDHAGIVEAPYALPAPELAMTSIRERRYRGYCITDMSKFDETFALFNQLKKEIYAVYENPLLEPGYIKSTTRFLDEFYKTINDPKAAKAALGYPCDKNGTGNVVIMGLDKD